MNTTAINVLNNINAYFSHDFILSQMEGFYFGEKVKFDRPSFELEVNADVKPQVIFYGPYINLGDGQYSIEICFSSDKNVQFEFYVYANTCKYIMSQNAVFANQVNVIKFEIDNQKIKKNSVEFVLLSNNNEITLIQLQNLKLTANKLKNVLKRKITSNVSKAENFSADIISNAFTNLENARILLGHKTVIQRSADTEPALEDLTSQLCSASQFYSSIYAYWCEQIREAPRLHRKQWEFVYILQALKASGMLTSGKRGLGFGCGKEPLPSLMAMSGCEIVATDLDASHARDKGWVSTNQHAAELGDLYFPNICEKLTFDKNLTFKSVDMNHIPRNLNGFDFTWSACAFEHLGSISNGLEFVINSVKCLKPGGIAVHTTEFNLTSNTNTFESKSCVFFRKRDLELLIKKLEKMGCTVMPLNLTIGELVEDGFVDLPPYKSEPHLKLAMQGHITTSIGLIIKKKNLSKKSNWY